jgi:hypothetical protein
MTWHMKNISVIFKLQCVRGRFYRSVGISKALAEKGDGCRPREILLPFFIDCVGSIQGSSHLLLNRHSNYLTNRIKNRPPNNTFQGSNDL